MRSHSGELVRILSHLSTAQPPAALLELILIGMQLLFFFTTFIMSVFACCSQTVRNGTD